jgi:DNA-binding response OmpR family regulator
VDELEDWVRLPVDQGDIRVRVDTLARRAEQLLVPSIDSDDVVHYDGTLAPLSPVEARLARPLIERYRTVVSRSDLTRAAWSGDAPGRNALDVHVSRLRRRLETAGLTLRTIRSRGYLLEVETMGSDPRLNSDR